MARKSKFTEAQQKAAVNAHLGGKSIDALAKELGVTKTTFYSWKNKFGGKKPKKAAAKKPVAKRTAAKPAAAAKPAGGRGRPKGSTKKKTAVRKAAPVAMAAKPAAVAKPAGGRGRPKGTTTRKRTVRRRKPAVASTATTATNPSVAALQAENAKLKKMLFNVWLKENL